MASYATVEQYRVDTLDESSDEARVTAVLEQQSAKLRAMLGIGESRALSGDAATLARLLVTDAARKQLVPPSFEGVGEVAGATQTSFTANGFQGSYTLANPSGSAYFDRSNLAALRKLLGRGQRIGIVCPSYGGGRC